MSKGISPTVGNFFVVLGSLLTQEDQRDSAREMKRGGHVNIYRLGHWLEAKQKVEDKILRRVGQEEAMTSQIAGNIVEVMTDYFTVNFRSNEFDLSACRKFIKQLEAFVSSGKNPSLIAK